MEAAELGIGSCWVGYFNADQVSEVLGLPEDVTVCALLPIGYPADDAKPLPLHTQYRELDDIVSVI
jgi:nitroreductase